MGVAHARLFEMLADRYSDDASRRHRRRPRDKAEFLADSSELLASFCDEGNASCLARAAKTAVREPKRSIRGGEGREEDDDEIREIACPDSFEPALVASMRQVESTLRRGEDVDDVTEELASTRRAIRRLEGVSDDHRDAALIGLSIVDSTIDVLRDVYEDPDHPLYGVHFRSYFSRSGDDGDESDGDETIRGLQNYGGGYSGFDVAGMLQIALPVLMVAFQTAIEAAESTIAEGVTDPMSLIVAVISSVLPAVIGVMLGSGNYYDDGENDYDDDDAGGNDDDGTNFVVDDADDQNGGGGGNDDDFYDDNVPVDDVDDDGNDDGTNLFIDDDAGNDDDNDGTMLPFDDDDTVGDDGDDGTMLPFDGDDTDDDGTIDDDTTLNFLCENFGVLCP